MCSGLLAGLAPILRPKKWSGIKNPASHRPRRVHLLGSRIVCTEWSSHVCLASAIADCLTRLAKLRSDNTPRLVVGKIRIYCFMRRFDPILGDYFSIPRPENGTGCSSALLVGRELAGPRGRGWLAYRWLRSGSSTAGVVNRMSGPLCEPVHTCPKSEFPRCSL